VGGFAPWRVEITHAVDGGATVGTAGGTHEVVVRVVDSTDGAQVGQQLVHSGLQFYLKLKFGGCGLFFFRLRA
jgi:hypothetical protein